MGAHGGSTRMSEIPLRATAGPQAGSTPPLLEIAEVTMRFGGIVALEGVTFSVANGRIVGLIGPNGAGKTTLFNCLSRLYRPLRGDIRLNGRSLRRCAPSDIATMGIGRTFQSPTLFASMSVLDNVKVGAHARGRNGPLADAVTLPSARREERDSRPGRARDARLRRTGERGGTAGRQPDLCCAQACRAGARARRPTVAACCSTNPPADSITTKWRNSARLIRSIRDRLAITILLVEHHMGLVMSLSDQVVVLNFGRVIADGPPDEVRSNPAVTEAYLGTRH